MKQTLIKITDDHYVVVDDSEIKEGDWMFENNKSIGQASKITQPSVDAGYPDYSAKKITHSTEPLNKGFSDWFDVKPLSLSEVKELIGEVDVEKKAEARSNSLNGLLGQDKHSFRLGFQDGYNQALEDNKDKKYTEEDVIKAIKMTRGTDIPIEVILKSLQSKTEWEVEFVENKLKLKN